MVRSPSFSNSNHDGCQRHRRNFELLADFIEGGVLVRITKRRTDQIHDVEREAFAHGVGQSWFASPDTQERRLLVIERKLRTDEKDQPTQVQPDKRRDGDGKAGINELRAACIENESREKHTGTRPEKSAEQSAYERGGNSSPWYSAYTCTGS